MRINPLHYLSERQIKLLARDEGVSVPQLLARYERLRVKTSGAAASKKAPSKVRRTAVRMNPGQAAGLAKGQSLMAEAAEAYRDGEYDSMSEALSGVAAERRSNPYGRYR